VMLLVGDCIMNHKLYHYPLVEYALTEKFKADDLRMLYKVCFEVTGKVSNFCIIHYQK